jgi:glycosyltransferase involved in cell wall biosynthesis
MIAASFAFSLLIFRGDLIKELTRRGHEVVTIAPEKAKEYKKRLMRLGASYIQVNIQRTGINPIKDIISFFKIMNTVRQEKPDVFLAYTAKPVIYGCLAAKLIKTQYVYALITGLGSIFNNNDPKSLFIRLIMRIQYKISLGRCTNVFFQNPDDLNSFIELRILRNNKGVVVNGSGVNLNYFKSHKFLSGNNFLFVGRLLKDKGIIEYIKAAKIVRSKFKNANFMIIGPFGTNPLAISKNELKDLMRGEMFNHIEWIDDIRPYYRKCFVYVLPSYHEGTPRSVLEAMATARPIITTDAPGCRETVIDSVNGFLVPVKNVKVLAEKMMWMLENKEEAKRMGEESLRICKEKYDVEKVNNKILDVMNL